MTPPHSPAPPEGNPPFARGSLENKGKLRVSTDRRRLRTRRQRMLCATYLAAYKGGKTHLAISTAVASNIG